MFRSVEVNVQILRVTLHAYTQRQSTGAMASGQLYTSCRAGSNPTGDASKISIIKMTCQNVPVLVCINGLRQFAREYLRQIYFQNVLCGYFKE